MNYTSVRTRHGSNPNAMEFSVTFAMHLFTSGAGNSGAKTSAIRMCVTLVRARGMAILTWKEMM